MEIDLDRIPPLVGEGSQRALPVSEAAGVAIDRAYIGSCTTGNIKDLRLAARVLWGHRAAVPTVIAPGSNADAELLHEARLEPDDPQSPTLAEVFHRAGCDLGMPGCSACVNAMADLVDEPSSDAANVAPRRALTVIATAVGNVSARRAARIHTASPITAARAAIRGRIA